MLYRAVRAMKCVVKKTVFSKNSHLTVKESTRAAVASSTLNLTMQVAPLVANKQVTIVAWWILS